MKKLERLFSSRSTQFIVILLCAAVVGFLVVQLLSDKVLQASGVFVN